MVTLPVRLLMGGLLRLAPWLVLLWLGAMSLAQAQVRTVATPTVEPAAVRIGVAEKVRIWADIGDPKVIAGGVNLLKVGAPGTNPTVAGVLKDDGTGGDEIAGDGRYTIAITVNEPAPTTLVYRISAPFKGTLLRTVTPNLPLAVVANRVPMAVPGGNQVVRTGALVRLDGRASYDLDADLLRFRWTLTPPAGSAAALDGTNYVKPSFTADRAGRYRVTLVVNDGQVDSVVKEIAVDASDGNAAPTAVLTGPSVPFGAAAMASVPLLGSGSDPENQALTYAWALKGKPATSTGAGLSSLTGPTPQLLADKPGRYLLELTVNDGAATSAPVQAVVTLYKPNTPPTANVGVDPAATSTGSLVSLQGAVSDADGDPLTAVRWTFIAKPANSNAALANPATLTPGFTADQPGDYLLEMSATDSRGSTGKARVVVRAITLPPVTITSLLANPGSGTVPLTVNFLAQASGGTGSFGYGWSFGDNGTDNRQNPQHVYTQPGTYIATVTATDTQSSAAQKSVTIVANPVQQVTNQAPKITQAAATVTLPLSLGLDPTVADDGLPNPPAALTYSWSQVSGPAGQPPAPPASFAPVAFNSTDTRTTTVTFDPTGPGTYVLRLTVSDGALTTSLDITVTVLAQPQTAPAMGPLPNQTVRLGDTLSIALPASDLNARDLLAYALLAAPQGASLVPAGSPRLTFTPHAGQVGVHPVTVQVRDATHQSAQASFNIVVVDANRAPQFTGASRADASASVGATHARTLVATDPDVGDSLTYALVSGPSGLSISAAGVLTWTPAPSQRGDHVVKATVTDSSGAADFSMFTLTVGNNLAPIARDDVYEVRVNSLLTVSAASGVLANDADPDTGGNVGLTARKLTDPSVGNVTGFAGDGSFTYQAPATPPGDPLTLVKLWNASAGSDRFHELAADLNGDGTPDVVSFDNNAGIRARSGLDGSQLWSADRTGATDCTVNSGSGMDHRVLADLDDSGHPALALTSKCTREGSTWHDSVVAFDHLGKVKWVSPPLSKPHPDIRRGATPVPPGGFTPGGLAWQRGLSVARLTAGGAPVLLLRAEIPVNDGYSYYVDAANAYHYAGCRAVTGLVADENVACRATLVISGVDGSVLQTLVVRNPAAVAIFGGPQAMSQMPPIAMDLDGDGRVDLVSGTEVWMQNAGGGFDFTWQLTHSVHDTAVADLDGDGKAEIVHLRNSQIADADLRGIFIYSHDGRLQRRIPLQGGWITPLTIADVDGDGRSDIVVGADGTLYAFRDDGRPIWAYVAPPDVPSDPILAPIYTQPAQYSQVANAAPQVYDLDGDGVTEVVFSGYGRIMIVDGRTGVRKLDPYWTFNFSYSDISALMLVDVNNDGHVDILQNAAFFFNCLNPGVAPACAGLVGPTVLRGGGSNNWLPGPKTFPNVQYRSTAIDDNARVLHDTKVSRIFRVPQQQGAVRDPRLAQATSFTYEAGDGSMVSAPAQVIINIAPDNKPPVFTSAPPKSLLQAFAPTPPGGLVTHYYDVAATDSDPGDTVTFSLKSAPAWVTMSGPARIRFEPTCGSYGYPCPWGWTTVVVTATDSRGAGTDQIFIVNLTTTAVTVPNVVGMSLAAAKSALTAQELQGVQWVETFAVQPAGTVLAQDAAAGAAVGRLDDIRLTVSKGLQPVLVPNVVGATATAATTQLANAGFAAIVSRQFSIAVAAGRVISQSPPPGTTAPPGEAQILVSSGNGLALELSRGLMPANESIVVTPIATDVDGNQVPTPSLIYAITPKQEPFMATLPTMAGNAIVAGATTMGAFIVKATDVASGRTATAEFAVGLPTDASGEGSSASIARFLAVLQGIDEFAPALRAARAANDVPQMKVLLGQIVTLWRTIDLDDLKDSMVIVFTQGFVPSRRDLDAFGLQPTGDDLLIRQVMRDAAADLDAWTQALRGSGTSLATLNMLADRFVARASRIDALTVSEYGVVLSQPEYQLLIAHRIPAFYEAVMEEAAELAGLPRRSSAFPLRKRASASHAAQLRAPLMKSTLAELAVTQAVGYITDKIMEKGLETYKNAKKFATDIMKQAAWGAGAVAIASHVRQLAYGSSIIETVSGASLSFRVFNAPYTFIEVITNAEPSLNDVMIIGPDITDNTVAAVKGLLDSIKDGFSFGKDALTNPKRYRNQDEAQKTKKELRKRVKALQEGAQGLFDVTSSMYQSPDEVERGCIFDANPDCRQLHYGSGFASVYTYSPPPGFLCYSGLPLPIPIIVQDQVSGLMYFGTPAFLPTPKTPPPNCP